MVGDFPGGPVVKNLLQVQSLVRQLRSHMLRSNCCVVLVKATFQRLTVTSAC